MNHYQKISMTRIEIDRRYRLWGNFINILVIIAIMLVYVLFPALIGTTINLIITLINVFYQRSLGRRLRAHLFDDQMKDVFK